MAARQYYYAAATAEATTTATADTAVATLTFTPDDNSDYVIMWSCLSQAPGLSVDTNVKLLQGTTATLNAINWESPDTTTYRALGGVAVATFATATGSHSFNITHGNETTTSTGNKIKETHLIAIKLATSDAWMFSTATTRSTTATTYQTAATLSFTPSATGDYLIIGSAARASPSAVGAAPSILLNVAGTGTDYGYSKLAPKDTSNFYSWVTTQQLPLTASQWDVAIQLAASTATGGISEARDFAIVSMRLDGGFESHYFAEERPTVTVTATATGAYSKSATLEFAPTATAQYLTLFGGHTRTNSAAIDVENAFDGTNIGRVDANIELNVATAGAFFFGIKRWDATSTATRTWNVLHGVETTATGAFIEQSEAFITLLQLDAGSAGGASTFNVSADTNVKFFVATVRQGSLSHSSRVIYRASLTKQAAISKSATYKWSATAEALKVLNVIADATVKFSAATVRQGQLLLSPLVDWAGTQTGQIGKLLSATSKFSATVARSASLNFSALYSWSAAAAVLKVFQLALDATVRFSATVARETSLFAAAVYSWGTAAVATFISGGGTVIIQLTLDATYRFAAVSDDFLRAFVKAFSGHAGLGLLFRRRRRNTIKRAR